MNIRRVDGVVGLVVTRGEDCDCPNVEFWVVDSLLLGISFNFPPSPIKSLKIIFLTTINKVKNYVNNNLIEWVII